MLEAELSSSDFLWLSGSLCQLSRIPFDPALVAQRFPAPHTVGQFIESSRSLGFRVAEHKPSKPSIAGLHLPCVGFVKPDGQAEDTSRRAQAQPAIVVKADAERLLYFLQGNQSPQVVPVAQFVERFYSYVLLIRPEAPANALESADGAPATTGFGFRWFAKELLRHRRIWRDILTASLAIQLIGLATPLFTQVIIDKVVVHQTSSTLIAIAVALAMFMLFSSGMTWLRQYLVMHTGNRVDAVLGSQVFERLLRLALPYFEHRPTGTLVARLQAVETIREFLAGAAVAMILDLPFLFIFLAVMLFYSWQLSLIAVGLMALIVILSAIVTPLFRARLNHQFLLGARNQAFVTEYVAGMETVKALQMEPRLQSRYEDYLASYLAAGFSTRKLSSTYNVVANALEQTMVLAILCVGALLVMRNDGFTIGMLVAFQMFASRMSQPLLRLAGLWQEFQQASIAVKRLGDIMDAPPEPYTLTPSRTAEGKGEIQVRQLAFRYSSTHPFLYRNLSLTIKPGKLSVLTGPSGSGKSTLAKLLLGFYQPTEGQILVDGKDVQHLSANELRHYFGVVPQETCLFSGSIYENLIAANPNVGFDDVVQACKFAEVHEVIDKLPQGYNTQIGEHGVGLSGGQKQRLAIARAVLKRPKILIFDEATSSLDLRTAESFARTVNQLKGRVTILFVAHAIPRGLEVDEVLQFGATAQAGDTNETPTFNARQMSVVEDEPNG